MRIHNVTFSLLLILTLPGLLMASGFGLYDANAKATGMGAAFTGRADDASAIYYNPAGIAFLDGKNILMAVTPVQPHVEVTFGGQTTESEQRWVYVPSMFYSQKLTDRIAVGIGVFAPIGLGVQYPATYNGAFISYRSMGLSAFVRPTLAVKLTDELSIGVGLDIVYSRMKEWRRLPLGMLGFPVDGSVDARYEFSDYGYGFAVGALYKPSDSFSIGAKYRHRIGFDYEGDVDFTAFPTGFSQIDQIVNGIFVDQDTFSGIDMPSEVTVGIMYKPMEELSLQADVAWTEWSTVTQIFLGHTLNSAIDSPWPMMWEDTWMVRLGAEYWMNSNWAVRGGYVRDNTPIPAETLTPFAPDADRNEFTAGFGYDSKEQCCWGNWHVDAAFRLILLEDRTSEFAFYPAEFSTNMTFFALSAGFRF